MAKFKYSETKYLNKLIDDIRDGKLIKLGSKSENEVHIEFNQDIKNLANNPMLIKDTVFTGMNGKEYKFTDFFKGTYSGYAFNGLGTDDKTSLQEVGVVIAIDSLLHSGESLNLETYKPSNKVKARANIDSVLSFLRENKSWFKSVNDSALGIVNKIGANHSLKNYTIHHDDEIFKRIRYVGKKLSGLSSEDRWNPSDFYFIKNFNIDEI